MDPITVAAASIVIPFALGAFSVVVWPVFMRRVAKDPRSRDASGATTPFYRVHRLLTTLGVTLGVLAIATSILVAVVLLPLAAA